MEERPLVDMSLETLKHVFATYSPGRTRPESYDEIGKLVSRLQRELPDSEVHLCLTGFSEDVDCTEFAIRVEKTGPGRRWIATDNPSKVIHVDERKGARIWFTLRIEGDCTLQYCVNRKGGSPWRVADEAGVAALVSEAKEVWEGIETPAGATQSWRSDTATFTF